MQQVECVSSTFNIVMAVTGFTLLTVFVVLIYVIYKQIR